MVLYGYVNSMIDMFKNLTTARLLILMGNSANFFLIIMQDYSFAIALLVCLFVVVYSLYFVFSFIFCH